MNRLNGKGWQAIRDSMNEESYYRAWALCSRLNWSIMDGIDNSIRWHYPKPNV